MKTLLNGIHQKKWNRKKCMGIYASKRFDICLPDEVITLQFFFWMSAPPNAGSWLFGWFNIHNLKSLLYFDPSVESLKFNVVVITDF